MTLNNTIDIKPDHISCTTSGQYTPEEGIRTFRLVLDSCSVNRINKALIDITSITQAHMATEKILLALHVERAFVDFLKENPSISLRIAVFGTEPLITKYKPSNEHYRQRNIPIRTFDSRAEAEQWLFADDV